MKRPNKTSYWQSFDDDRLLELPMSSFDLPWRGTPIQGAITQVKQELKMKGFRIKLNFWPSSEWFCPDGHAGVAFPFYLLHQRLTLLETHMMGMAEGADYKSAQRILRHEIGHALDNIYSLRRRKDRIEVFGKSSVAYPRSYDFKRYSRKYVRNLPDGYAQAHPAEDFAETFAVWLDPESDWKKRYKTWPCYEKLIYMDRLMHELCKEQVPESCLDSYEHISTINQTLKDYYRKKRSTTSENGQYWLGHMRRILCTKENASNGLSAFTFLRHHKESLISDLHTNSNIPRYLLARMYNDLMSVSRRQKLCLIKNELESKNLMSYYLRRRMTSYFSTGKHQINL